jgi:hypothetical protein
MKRCQTYVKVQISPQFVMFSIESLIENFDQFNHIPAKINSHPWFLIYAIRPSIDQQLLIFFNLVPDLVNVSPPIYAPFAV